MTEKSPLFIRDLNNELTYTFAIRIVSDSGDYSELSEAYTVGGSEYKCTWCLFVMLKWLPGEANIKREAFDYLCNCVQVLKAFLNVNSNEAFFS